jgi:hypothetical protein
MPIKTFRGLIADGVQDTISLHTNDGSMGYRIVKFQIFPNLPGTVDLESVVAIWKVKQSSVSATTATVDFSDPTLLGVAYLKEGEPLSQANTSLLAIFDQEIFNQDIYVTHIDTNHTYSCNYYIELEQVKLDLNENTVATLKDIRNNA